MTATSPTPFRRGGRLPGVAAGLESFFVRHRRRIAWVHAAMFVGFLVLFGLPLLVNPAPENA
ncbi:MAG TPA: hypothetical protein VEB64_05995, partial [Azospirillaceae bacterium]|nr:hypothetical protein [Azospirillaceae bacterium]